MALLDSDASVSLSFLGKSMLQNACIVHWSAMSCGRRALHGLHMTQHLQGDAGNGPALQGAKLSASQHTYSDVCEAFDSWIDSKLSHACLQVEDGKAYSNGNSNGTTDGHKQMDDSVRGPKQV